MSKTDMVCRPGVFTSGHPPGPSFKRCPLVFSSLHVVGRSGTKLLRWPGAPLVFCVAASLHSSTLRNRQLALSVKIWWVFSSALPYSVLRRTPDVLLGRMWEDERVPPLLLAHGGHANTFGADVGTVISPNRTSRGPDCGEARD